MHLYNPYTLLFVCSSDIRCTVPRQHLQVAAYCLHPCMAVPYRTVSPGATFLRSVLITRQTYIISAYPNLSLALDHQHAVSNFPGPQITLSISFQAFFSHITAIYLIHYFDTLKNFYLTIPLSNIWIMLSQFVRLTVKYFVIYI